MLASLGRLAYARRRVVALVWLGVLVTGLAVGGSVFARLDTGAGLREDTEAAVAERRLADLGGAGPDVLVLLDGLNAEDPKTRADVSAFAQDLRSLRDVRSVTAAGAAPRGGALVSADHQAQLVAVTLRRGISLTDSERVANEIRERAQRVGAERALVGGQLPVQLEFQRSSQRDLRIGELIAFPLILRLLVIVFRGFVAPVVPLVVAGVSVAGTLLLLLAVSEFAKLSTFSVNLATMVGLGLAVDYSLLMVSRFREERAAGADIEESIVRTVATAGRTVAFSGLTAAMAMAGLLVFAEPLLRSMAWGAIGVVALSVVAALTLLPALLGFWGARIKSARTVAVDGGLLYQVARRAQRTAVLVVPAVAVGLVLLAAPFRDIQLGGSGPHTLAAGSPSRELFETVRDRFPGGGSDPIVVLAEAGSGSTQIASLVDRLDDMPGAAAVAIRPGSPAGFTVIDVSYQGPSSSDAAQRLVRQIRALEAEPAVQVTGPSAHLFDFKQSVGQRLPYALGLIVLASFVLLFVMTGSVVIPIKAIAMNTLSLGASFGALVWIFQEGHLSDLLNFTAVGAIDAALPVLIFVFAFGLSMDYEVFLLSRIKESYDETGDNDLAVALGLQRAGPIIGPAAALMVTVLLGFSLAGELFSIKTLGVGLAIAILIDATVVRMLLVPATMTLLGRWNWWAPGPLRRLHQGVAERRFRKTAPATDHSLVR